MSIEQNSYKAQIQTELERVQRRLSDLTQTSDDLLDPLLETISKRSGKMLRPSLVLLCGKLFGDLRSEHIDLAAMVELIHTASLLHDDVIDQGQLRRGRPSANALWGNTAAVLLGDFLLSRAFALGAACRTPEAVSLLSETANTLCIGELKQNLLKAKWDLSEQEYFQIIQAKTAALFGCSCRLGAMASGAQIEKADALERFGIELGIAFQITDDLLDILSTAKQAGKHPGSDLVEQKMTLAVIHWVNAAEDQKQVRIEQLTHLSDMSDVARMLQAEGSIDYAQRAARRHLDNAARQIEPFAPSAIKDALLAITQDMMQRLC